MFLTDWKRDWGKRIDNWAPCWPKTFSTRCTIGLQRLLTAESRCTSMGAIGSHFHSQMVWPQKFLDQDRYWMELETNAGQTQPSILLPIASLVCKINRGKAKGREKKRESENKRIHLERGTELGGQTRKKCIVGPIRNITVGNKG